MYVEPAPPPPPAGEAAAGAPTEPVETPKPAPTPRLTLPAKPEKPKPVAKPKPAPKPVPPREVETPRPGVAGGESGGVAEGTPGGKLGGTVGGHGDAPITAELAANPPAIVSRSMPEYPYAARAAQVEGQVLLRAIVDREGHVEPDVTVLRSVPMLDAAAIAALRQWRFTPGRDHEGNTVRVVIEVPMRFQLR